MCSTAAGVAHTLSSQPWRNDSTTPRRDAIFDSRLAQNGCISSWHPGSFSAFKRQLPSFSGVHRPRKACRYSRRASWPVAEGGGCLFCSTQFDSAGGLAAVITIIADYRWIMWRWRCRLILLTATARACKPRRGPPPLSHGNQAYKETYMLVRA